MNIHEHQAKQIFANMEQLFLMELFITLKKLVEKSKSLKTNKYILKAQIHAGGRGKAGGVKSLIVLMN